MNRLFPIVIPILLCAASAQADTTWVADGPLSGEWSAAGSPYYIVGNVWVSEGDTLTIGPGVEVLLDVFRSLQVFGYLAGYGTEEQPIIVHSASTNISYWSEGILVDSREPRGLRLEHCNFMACRIGVVVDSAHAEFDHCMFRTARATGVRLLRSAFAELVDCELIGDSAQTSQGMYIGGNSNASLIRTTISHQVRTDGPAIQISGSRLELVDCKLEQNRGVLWGGSISATNSFLSLSGCLFYQNTAMLGGAVFLGGDTTFAHLEIDRCVFRENNSGYRYAANGGGIFVNAQTCIVTRSTFVRNYSNLGSALRTVRPATINSCVFFENQNSKALYTDAGAEIRYCDFYSGFGDFDGDDLSPALGIVDRVNANGDSCDAFHNIYLTPGFVDLWNDFRLRPESPCIDAGDPAFGPDPDGTVCEIGAFGFEQLASPFEQARAMTRDLELLAAYPNPFNLQTTLRWRQERRERIAVTIYDLLGRRVSEIRGDDYDPGVHEVSWSVAGLPSGAYYVTIASPQGRQATLLTLIK